MHDPIVCPSICGGKKIGIIHHDPQQLTMVLSERNEIKIEFHNDQQQQQQLSMGNQTTNLVYCLCLSVLSLFLSVLFGVSFSLYLSLNNYVAPRTYATMLPSTYNRK